MGPYQIIGIFGEVKGGASGIGEGHVRVTRASRSRARANASNERSSLELQEGGQEFFSEHTKGDKRTQTQYDTLGATTHRVLYLFVA